jgi:DNA modification methylase
MNLQRVAVSKLRANPKNPRIIKDEKFQKLVQSIKDFPEMLELRPIVVDADYMVLGGNMRLKACQAAGLKEVPVAIAADLTPDQQREFVIKDNVGFGEWQWDALANEWDADQLTAWGLDLPSFEAEPATGQTDPDEVPETPVEPVIKPGDLIALGNHRLLCGDSTDATGWERLMAGRLAQMVWTDPPYGVNFSTDHLREWDGGKKRDRKAHGIENDDLDEHGLEQLLRGSLGLAFTHCADGAAWYVAAPPGPPFLQFSTVLHELSVWRQTLVWVKDSFVFGRSDYHYRHEAILYGWKPGAAHYFVDDRTQDTIWEIPRPKKNPDHPTMKPVELVQRAILNSSKPGDLIIEPFGGSGTTLLAAETTQRVAAVIELDPRYCDVIVKRWQDFTGRTATYADTGQPVALT